MTALRQALADYLAVRRVLGYRLVRTEKLLAQSSRTSSNMAKTT